ncbi:odorant receptor 82a-like [Ostrinia furnacalis]|uniref:odorant receptor 82a-like n=1 Tax=Ostrinia furnacalis TaxID=93504 RepID=UPI00103DEDC5|nr:odorant receptor 82a-like [Ostrinia furnacalis]
MEFIKRHYREFRSRMQDYSYDSLLSIVNFVPSLVGFSILGNKISAPFWILHLSLLFYIYGVGCTVYQVKYAGDARDFIKCYVNVSLLILIANNSHWFLLKRPLLKSILLEISQSDALATANEAFRGKHKRAVQRIKRILYMFYGFNLTNAMFVYLPNRMDVKNSYSMTPCYGMEPLTASPNKEICSALLLIQEISIMTVVLNYQALLVVLIAYTALLYRLLSEEIMTLNNYDRQTYFNNPIAKTMLHELIKRHVILLSIIDKLKSLYSGSIGINFGSNAVCMSLFFYLPLQEWLQFMPVVVYCFLVFFLYCFLCQRLTNAAEYFEQCVYSCGWENFDVKEKKAIYFMLRQAQRPVEILAADIIPVNISTFATTLQAMFKFVTVVKV